MNATHAFLDKIKANVARMLLLLGDVTYSLETHSVHSNSIYSKILYLGKVANGYNTETV